MVAAATAENAAPAPECGQGDGCGCGQETAPAPEAIMFFLFLLCPDPFRFVLHGESDVAMRNRPAFAS